MIASEIETSAMTSSRVLRGRERVTTPVYRRLLGLTKDDVERRYRQFVSLTDIGGG